MITASRYAENVVTAFLDGPDDPNIPNAIHSTEGAKAYGYRAELVGGVTVWGWATPTILEALGERWLEVGWARVRFRRPTYPGDRLTVRVEPASDDSYTFRMTKPDGDDVLAGEVGLGRAPWLDELARSRRLDAEEGPPQLPQMTLELTREAGEIRAMATEDGCRRARVRPRKATHRAAALRQRSPPRAPRLDCRPDDQAASSHVRLWPGDPRRQPHPVPGAARGGADHHTGGQDRGRLRTQGAPLRSRGRDVPQ